MTAAHAAKPAHHPADNLLATWIAEEAAIRARLDAGPGPGVARRDQVAGRSGLELMQGMLDGHLPFAAIAATLDFLLVEVAPGRAVFQGTPGAQLLLQPVFCLCRRMSHSA